MMARFSIRPSVLFLSMVACFFIKTNNGLRIEVKSGGPYSELIPSEVSISCLTDDEGDDVKEIEILQITREGHQHWLAYISRRTDRFDNKPGGDIQIHGQVDNEDIRQNFLNLTLMYPKTNDTGTYSCVQYYLDGEQILRKKVATTNLVVDDVHKWLKGLVQKVYSLEKALETATNNKECACDDKIKALERVIEKQTAQTNQTEVAADNNAEQISTLMVNLNILERRTRDNKKAVTSTADSVTGVEERVLLVEQVITQHSKQIKLLKDNQTVSDHTCTDSKVDSSVQETLTRLERLYHNQSRVIRGLSHKVSSYVAFSASLSENLSPVEGGVLVFDATKVNEGQGYDEKSGIFRAPVDGMYAFQLTAQLDPDNTLRGSVNMGIVANSAMIAKLRLSTVNSKQGSVSDVVTLKKGDQVRVMAISVDEKSDISQLALYYNEYTVFSGYLVKRP